MFQAEMQFGESQESLWLEAKDALMRLEQQSPGAGSWNMACIAARMKQPDLCKSWLGRASSMGTLPESETIRKSSYFKAYRDEAWFKDALKTD